MDSIPSEIIGHNYVSTPDVEVAIKRLGMIRATERDTMVRLRFEAGDIFNRMHFDTGARSDRLKERYGEADYEFFRHCAWVAYRWPKKDRIAGKPWRYFRDEQPGQAPREPKIPSYDQSDSRWEGGVAYMVGTNGRGRSVKIRTTPEALRIAADLLDNFFGEETP